MCPVRNDLFVLDGAEEVRGDVGVSVRGVKPVSEKVYGLFRPTGTESLGDPQTPIGRPRHFLRRPRFVSGFRFRKRVRTTGRGRSMNYFL